MNNFDNNLNKINNIRNPYAPNSKKTEADVSTNSSACELSAANEQELQKSELLGRTMVSKQLNPETIKAIKEAIEFQQNNPELVCAAIRACDDAVDLGLPYEEACCEICDAAYSKYE